ncbi:MAG: YebC/PmpR family DNA-binding transcriptional regulator [Candidatus Paceibacterota bacterium]
MSGHNKWTQIKHKKGAEDAKRSKLFSMLVRTIMVESRLADGNREAPNLKAVIARAKAANMPINNIERAIEKGVGTNGESFEEVIYEAYGPGGVALLIIGLTDNKNRTTPEIKHLLSEYNINLSSQGSTQWAFVKKEDGWQAQNPIPLSDPDQEKLQELLEALNEHEDIKNIFHNVSEIN